MGLIRGSPALSFENDYNKDAERLRTLISMTRWSIWKSRNKSTILDQDVTPNETRETLKELIKDERDGTLHVLEEGERMTRQREIRKIWDGQEICRLRAEIGSKL